MIDKDKYIEDKDLLDILLSDCPVSPEEMDRLLSQISDGEDDSSNKDTN